MPRAYLATLLKDDGKPSTKWFAATSMPNLKGLLATKKAPDGDYKVELHILHKNGAPQICNLLMRRDFTDYVAMSARGSVEDGVLSIKRGSTEKFDKPKPVKEGYKKKDKKGKKVKEIDIASSKGVAKIKKKKMKSPF